MMSITLTLNIHINENTIKTLIKLPDWRKKKHNIRVMGSVFLLFAHTKPIYPTYFAGNLYPACIMATITPM